MGESNGSTVVGVRLAETRRAELEEYVEEHDEYDSVPALFRTAVAHELSDDYGFLGGQHTDRAGDEVGTIVSNITDLRNRIEDLSDEIKVLSDEIRGEGRKQTIERMAAVHRVLPTDPEDAITHDEIAEQFDDMDEETAWNTIMQLWEENGAVQRSDDGGWYTEGGQ